MINTLKNISYTATTTQKLAVMVFVITLSSLVGSTVVTRLHTMVESVAQTIEMVEKGGK